MNRLASVLLVKTVQKLGFLDDSDDNCSKRRLLIIIALFIYWSSLRSVSKDIILYRFSGCAQQETNTFAQKTNQQRGLKHDQKMNYHQNSTTASTICFLCTLHAHCCFVSHTLKTWNISRVVERRFVVSQSFIVGIFNPPSYSCNTFQYLSISLFSNFDHIL